MNDFTILIWLFPIVFMIHDFEEIIFLKYWISKNMSYLAEKFPRISKRLLPRYANFSTAGFALAVAEEFVLFSLVTVGSVIFENYVLWLAMFMGFFVHLLMHVCQWILVKRYIPAIYTSFFALIYCIYTLYIILSNNIFSISEIAVWTIIGLAAMGVNLLFAHTLARWVD